MTQVPPAAARGGLAVQHFPQRYLTIATVCADAAA
jgi:hypothetical protein